MGRDTAFWADDTTLFFLIAVLVLGHRLRDRYGDDGHG
jgi:hypothetical protein